jgi:hypothetical protein
MVGLLTTEEKDQLIGQKYSEDSYFNPIQDIDGNWIISMEEMVFSTYEEFRWVKNISMIEFKPKIDI